MPEALSRTPAAEPRQRAPRRRGAASSPLTAPLLASIEGPLPGQRCVVVLQWQDEIDAADGREEVLTVGAGAGLLERLARAPDDLLGMPALAARIERRGRDGDTLQLLGVRRMRITGVQQQNGLRLATAEPIIEAPVPDAAWRRLCRAMAKLAQQGDGTLAATLQSARTAGMDRAQTVFALIASQAAHDRELCGRCAEAPIPELVDVLEQTVRRRLGEELAAAARVRQLRSRIGGGRTATLEVEEDRDDPDDSESERLQEVRRQIERDPLLRPLSEGQKQALAARVQRSGFGSVDFDIEEYARRVPKGPQAVPEVTLQAAAAQLDAELAGLHEQKQVFVDWIREDVHRQAQGLPVRGHAVVLAGPPGTGKTMLASRLSTVLRRPLIRIPAGSPSDDIRIMGVSPAWKNAGPGEIVLGLIRAGTLAVVIQIDEIDKLFRTERGAATLAAILNLLDPEQHGEFWDLFLGFPLDLSMACWVLTANDLSALHPALLSRADVVLVPGYTREDKLAMLRTHLLPQVLAAQHVGEEVLDLDDEAAAALVDRHDEPGVRALVRDLRRLVVRHLPAVGAGPVRLDARAVHAVFPPSRPVILLPCAELPVGSAALACVTPLGGGVATVQAVLTRDYVTPVIITGHAGEELREAALAAWSWLRAHADEVGVPAGLLDERGVHIHLPIGWAPKDGPSAGLAIACALVSACLQRRLRARMVLTGEVDLLGAVLPVGGVIEKARAVRHAGLQLVVPSLNAAEAPDAVAVSTIAEALEVVGLTVGSRKHQRRRQP